MTNYGRVSRQVCLHCACAYISEGRCRRCGKPNTDAGRIPSALPFGYRLCSSDGSCYQIGRVLGHGGFGITYLAWDEKHRFPVALKELFPNKFDRDPRTRAVRCPPEDYALFRHYLNRFVEEARLIARLNSEPEIIKIYDYFEANGTGYYAMEYLRGMDIRHWLEQKQAPLTWAELETSVRQILRGLGVLHGYGFIHRDISPDNLFLCDDHSVKLIDFGSVRSVDSDHFTTILKRNYAPPEQLVSAPNQGFWTDTFSLCATVYYLLSLKLPAQGAARYEALSRGKRDPLIPLSAFRPAAPDYVCRAVMHGLALAPERRFRNIAEMKAAFYPQEQDGKNGRGCILECVSGVLAGRRFFIPAGTYASLGRGQGTNTIAFPGSTPEVSRRHCVFYAHLSGMLYVQDQESTFGTAVNHVKIPPLKWTALSPGQTVIIGREVLKFKTAISGGLV